MPAGPVRTAQRPGVPALGCAHLMAVYLVLRPAPGPPVTLTCLVRYPRTAYVRAAHALCAHGRGGRGRSLDASLGGPWCIWAPPCIPTRPPPLLVHVRHPCGGRGPNGPWVSASPFDTPVGMGGRNGLIRYTSWTLLWAGPGAHGPRPACPPPPSHYDTPVGVGVLMDPGSTPALSVPLWGWGS